MFLRHLSYFVTLAREKHFARAAEACHVSQPTLSAAIRKLEEDLEVRLAVRGHRFLGLTAEGERVLAWAQQILSDYEGLRIDLTGLRSGLSGSLRLGVIPAAMPLVSCLTARFSSIHPAATVEVMSMTSRSIQKGNSILSSLMPVSPISITSLWNTSAGSRSTRSATFS